MVSRKLIYDIGLNNGEDCAFYLNKGFDVVAIEASPILCKSAEKKFADYITAGRMKLLNIGVWSEDKTLQFFINLQNDHWSSFDPAYGCRGGTPFEVIDVPCKSIGQILAKFGAPYYMKIDVEGADKIILEGLKSVPELPTFISVEEYGVKAVDDLLTLGYRKFQIVAQRTKDPQSPPFPAREGTYAPAVFNGLDSGVFGEELPQDQWRSYEEARHLYLTSVRDEKHTYRGPEHEWYDIHAMI